MVPGRLCRGLGRRKRVAELVPRCPRLHREVAPLPANPRSRGPDPAAAGAALLPALYRNDDARPASLRSPTWPWATPTLLARVRRLPTPGPCSWRACSRPKAWPWPRPATSPAPGWTTAELQAATAQPAPTYGLVLLLIGGNNQYQGLVQYRNEFRALLQQAIGFAGGRPGHVVVLSIPD